MGTVTAMKSQAGIKAILKRGNLSLWKIIQVTEAEVTRMSALTCSLELNIINNNQKLSGWTNYPEFWFHHHKQFKIKPDFLDR